MAIELDLVPEGAGRAAESALPERIADHGGRYAAAALVILRAEKASAPGPHSQRREEVAAHQHSFGRLDFASARQIKLTRAPCREAAECALLTPQLVPLRVGQVAVARSKVSRC